MNLKLKLNCVGLGLVCVLTTSAAVAAGNYDWPQWRGPDRSDVSKETGLLKSWPAEGPKRVWMFENAGAGYAGFAVSDGRVYTLGTRDNSEIVLALNAADGKEVWATPLSGILENGWGNGPRGTPTVDGDHVYALSGNGTLVCATKAAGKVVWTKKMSDLGGKVPGWGYTESPLVEGDLVVCTPGGAKGAIAAFDKKSGDFKWQSAEFTDGAQYSSIIPVDLNGARQLVQLTMKSVAGVAAKDGKLLWRADWPGRTAVIPTPIHRDGFIYVTSGYGVGCMQIKVGPDNTVTGVYTNKVMKNHHGGVILVGDHLYGHADAGWTCQDFKTGAEVWNHRGFGKGAVAYADGMLYCLEEGSGTVVLVEATPKAWTEKSRFKLDPQSKIRNPQGRIWTHPVISNGRLYLRDQDLIYCFDIKG